MNNYIDYEILKPKEGSKIIAYFYGNGFEITMIMTYFSGDLLNNGFYININIKMSNWIDIEILPPKEGICANKIVGQQYVIVTNFEDNWYYQHKETSKLPLIIPNSIVKGESAFWGISNNAIGMIYKYKYE